MGAAACFVGVAKGCDVAGLGFDGAGDGVGASARSVATDGVKW